MFATRARVLIATLWVGSLWTIGYLVAPTLFATLEDRVLAGSIAGSLFRIEAWLSLACAMLLMMLLVKPGASDTESHAQRKVLWVVGGMLLCTLIGYFGLQPFMNALREAAGPGGVMASEAKTQFGILHGVSSAFYLIQSLLGIALALKLR